jgi:hypothetical protein
MSLFAHKCSYCLNILLWLHAKYQLITMHSLHPELNVVYCLETNLMWLDIFSPLGLQFVQGVPFNTQPDESRALQYKSEIGSCSTSV